MARDTYFLWSDTNQDVTYYVICNGETLNPEGTTEKKLRIDLPSRFNSTCLVRAENAAGTADSTSIDVNVIPMATFFVAPNKSYPDRPAYTLVNGELVNNGDRVAVGVPCDERDTFKTTRSGSWMRVSDNLYALCKEID